MPQAITIVSYNFLLKINNSQFNLWTITTILQNLRLVKTSSTFFLKYCKGFCLCSKKLQTGRSRFYQSFQIILHLSKKYVSFPQCTATSYLAESFDWICYTFLFQTAKRLSKLLERKDNFSKERKEFNENCTMLLFTILHWVKDGSFSTDHSEIP